VKELLPAYLDAKRIRLSSVITAQDGAELSYLVKNAETQEVLSTSTLRKQKIYSIENVQEMSIGETRNLILRAFYTGAPEVFAEESFTIIGMPTEKTKSFLELPDSNADNLNDVDKAEIKAKIGLSKLDASYSEAKFGKWKVEVEDYQRKRGFVPTQIAESKVIDDSNPIASWSINFNESGLQYIKPIAYLLDDAGRKILEKVGGTQSLFVFKKTLLEGELESVSNYGIAPFTTLFRYSPDKVTDYRHIAKIQWLVAKNQNEPSSQEYEILSESESSKGTIFKHLFENEGTYWTKARITTDGGLTFETSVLKTEVMKKVDVRIDAPAYLFPETEQTVGFTLDMLIPDSKIYDWVWRVNNEEVQRGGATYTLPAAEANTRRIIEVLAWDKRVTENDEHAVYKARASTRTLKPYPIVEVEGERVVFENDGEKSYRFEVKQVRKLLDKPLNFEWTNAKDEVVSSNKEMSFAPFASDLGVRIFYVEIWHEGYRKYSTKLKLALIVKTNKVPDFDILSRSLFVDSAPGYAKLEFRSKERRMRREDLARLNFEWIADPQKIKRLNEEGGIRFIARALTEGEHKIVLKVSSKETNDVIEKELQFNVAAAIFDSVFIEQVGYDEDKVEIKAVPSRIHSADSLLETKIFLNGERLLAERDFKRGISSVYSVQHNGLEEGLLRFEFETELGYKLQKEINFKKK
jgi:hypothetical protein